MISKKNKNTERKIRHKRVRAKISGTAARPRLAVYRSTNHIYVQVIDDVAQKTLCAASTTEKVIAKAVKDMNKTEQAKFVGQEIAKRAAKLNIKDVVFDRGGYIYIGRVQALADGAREAGLVF